MIKIKIKLTQVNENSVQFNLQIFELYASKIYYFYKDSLKLKAISGNVSVVDQGDFLQITPSTTTLNLDYEVEIGYLGKHGRQGLISSEEVIFYGEEVLLLPLEVIASRDATLAQYVDEIQFDLTLLQPDWCVNVTSPTWWDVYDLMKNSYCFKAMNRKSYQNMIMQFDDDFESAEIVYSHVCKLYDYFETVFGQLPHELTINFLTPIENQTYVFGGSSRKSMTATFDVDRIRDWQLLTHRLFHAFMDQHILDSSLHLPPHVWLTEGLAVYHEFKGMEAVFGYPHEVEMAKLFEQYGYARHMDFATFGVIPLNEARLNSRGKLEFLHYVQAPLLIFYWQSLVKKGELIEYLLQQPVFDLRALVETSLEAEAAAFAQCYLFSSQPLPLGNHLFKFRSNENELQQNLAYFKENMNSWFGFDVFGIRRG